MENKSSATEDSDFFETEDSEPENSLGETIIALRESFKDSGKKITQAEFAKLAGLSQSQLSDIETGKRDPLYSTVVRICKVVGIKPIELISKSLTNLNKTTKEVIEKTNKEISEMLVEV
jgi:transcriptional regulator with XRE-family HTH domain